MNNTAPTSSSSFEEELDPNLALDFIKSTCPSELYRVSNLPNLRHCVGTNRFWGPALGLTAFESLPENLQSKIYKTSLIRIAILTRTIFVVDDYIDDEKVSPKEKSILQQWLKNLMTEISANYINLGADINVFLKYHKQSRDAGMRRALKKPTDNIFDLSVEKFILFVNPFRFEMPSIFYNNTKFQNFLEYYFFTCQILDDFFDMEEDLIKKVNNNIFLTQLSIENQRNLSKYKGAFAMSIIGCIEQNFSSQDFEEVVGDSRVAQKYLDSLKYFLRKKKGELNQWHNEKTSVLQNLTFKEWYVSNDLFDSLVWSELELPPGNLLLDMRPELMQTEYFGFKTIEEV